MTTSNWYTPPTIEERDAAVTRFNEFDRRHRQALNDLADEVHQETLRLRAAKKQPCIECQIYGMKWDAGCEECNPEI